MGRSYSSDLRERVADEVSASQSRRAAARRFGVSASTGIRIAKRKELTGSVEPARIGRPAGSGKLTLYATDLIGWLETDDDITMPELAAKLAEIRQPSPRLVSVRPHDALIRGDGWLFSLQTTAR